MDNFIVSWAHKRCDTYRQSKRNIKLDILKGIAIFCVVWGHFIQQGTLEGILRVDNPVEQIIYAFHMPLFMLISGYLMYNSFQRRGLLQQWLHWCKNLVLPLIAWTLIAEGCIVLRNIILTGTFDFSSISILDFYQYWFIFALLICGVIASLIKTVLHDKTWIYITAVVILFVSTFNIFSIGWMWPFFVIGYLINKHSAKMSKFLPKLSLACLIAFPILVMFYSAASFSYISILSVTEIINNVLTGIIPSFPTFEYLDAISANIYKILTGIAGCGFVYCIVEKLTQANMPVISAAFSWFGQESLLIYFIQRIIIEIFIGRYFYATDIFYYDFILTLFLSIIGTIIFSLLASAIHKNKITNVVLAGGR